MKGPDAMLRNKSQSIEQSAMKIVANEQGKLASVVLLSTPLRLFAVGFSHYSKLNIQKS